MDSVQYYKQNFGHELLKVQNAASHNKISIVALLPGNKPSRGVRNQAFQAVALKPFFLFSFYFSILIDQAVHSCLREEHAYFENLTRYPKFVGILGSYHTNLHPGLLLLAATLWIPRDEEQQFADQFIQLADHMIKDYCHFFHNRYPELTGRLTSLGEQNETIKSILTAMSEATALLFIPTSVQPYTKLEPNYPLYESWMMYFSGLVNSKLGDY